MPDPADLSTPWALRVVVTLRVPELIASGITRIDDLARAAQADADSLARVLRHLVGAGYFVEPTRTASTSTMRRARCANPKRALGST